MLEKLPPHPNPSPPEYKGRGERGFSDRLFALLHTNSAMGLPPSFIGVGRPL